jgi:hypothetical protein
MSTLTLLLCRVHGPVGLVQVAQNELGLMGSLNTTTTLSLVSAVPAVPPFWSATETTLGPMRLVVVVTVLTLP